MITRRYFYCAMKAYPSGSGGYSMNSNTVTHKAFFSDSDFVFKECIKQAKEELSSFPGDEVVMTSFSKV